jgi:hypothetical protein
MEDTKTHQKYSVPFFKLGQTQSSMNWFISSTPATEPPVHVSAPPQLVPPPEGHPTSAMTCLIFLLVAVRATS